jgi:Protein of unknown function (DUF2510)
MTGATMHAPSNGTTVVATSLHPRLTGCLAVVAHTGCAVVASTSGFLGAFLFVYLAVAVVSIVAAVKVVTKAGYSGWWVLIAFVPLVGFVMTLVFAFSTWPVLREVESLRAQVRGGYGPPPWGGGLRGGPDPGPWGGPGSPAPAVPWSGGAPPGGAGWKDPVSHEADLAPLPPFDEVVPRARTTSADATSPPGWYPVPDGRQRYWDGTAWTEHYASARPDGS